MDANVIRTSPVAYTSEANVLRVPRAGELVLMQLPATTKAMIGKSQVELFKGTMVGNIVRGALSVISTPNAVVHEVEVEGGEFLKVRVAQMVAVGQPWVWERVS